MPWNFGWNWQTNKRFFSRLNQINFCSPRSFSTQIHHEPQILWPQNSSFMGDNDDNFNWNVLIVNIFWNVNQAKKILQASRLWRLIKDKKYCMPTDNRKNEARTFYKVTCLRYRNSTLCWKRPLWIYKNLS